MGKDRDGGEVIPVAIERWVETLICTKAHDGGSVVDVYQ